VPFRAQEQRLSGFSLRPVVRSRVYRPEWPDEVPAMLAEIPESLLPRGAGMAYGDAGLNDGRGTLDTRRLDRILALDEGAATVTCQGGVPLRDLVEVGLPRGLFPAVTPGTWKSTVGGCIACDVHGKNHHLAGNFLDHVLRFRLALADGRMVECSREENAELFLATAGGLGLTGVILDATLRLQRVSSAWMRVRYVKARDLDATFAALERSEPEPYSVAWLDVLARGARLGRSVLMLGAHAAPEDLPAELRAAPLSWSPGRSFRLPFAAPSGVMAPPLVRLFNSAYYASFPGGGAPRLEPLRRFFYPLEAIDNFSLLYGRRGLVEYQFVVPGRAAHAVLRTTVERLSRAGMGSFLCVVKRMGPGDGAPMSFPAEGVTIAVDVPFRGEPLLAMLRDLDELVAREGGRVYLAKDSRLEPAFVDAMYPRRREWARLLDRIDPGRRFDSTLARRLGLRDA
jgi:decaprenylphospho-beta-D-ribofuranose 2-oxidase